MSFRLLILALLSVLAMPALAKDDPFYTGFFSNVAVGGMDPVAYFTDGKPVEGNKSFRTEYKGVEFHFASAEHLALFKADPEKYVPQYGGYCAWAVSQGKTAKGDPEYWKIVDGKLYLNYSEDIQKKWEKDIPGFIKSADANWPRVLE
ncbi:MAG: YHS domain-containing protein [Pseudomonadales bacterium]|nr:YHS domain-containing protein [Pseudomonadales bacterium]